MLHCKKHLLHLSIHHEWHSPHHPPKWDRFIEWGMSHQPFIQGLITLSWSFHNRKWKFITVNTTICEKLPWNHSQSTIQLIMKKWTHSFVLPFPQCQHYWYIVLYTTPYMLLSGKITQETSWNGTVFMALWWWNCIHLTFLVKVGENSSNKHFSKVISTNLLYNKLQTCI